MRLNGVSNATVAGLLVAVILIGLTGFYVATTYQAKTVTAGSVKITSANISAMTLSITVKNTGSLDMIGLGEPTISLGGGVAAYFCAYNEYSWRPLLSPTYPIHTGEEVTGSCSLISPYSSGLQVTIYVPSTFSDGSQMKASTSITVS